MAEDPGGRLGGLWDGFASEPVLGMHVAGYRLEKRIGRGGMAVVYQARDEHLGRLVALKVLAQDLAADESFRLRFIRESRAAAAVDDPHILPVFGAGESDGVLYIAMRYVPGGDLGTVVQKDGRFSAGQTAAVITQAASALDAAHAAGLVHRDVKPANMLIDARGDRATHVYLSDFGLSKTALGTTASLTRTGQFLGSLNYVAPEQIEGGPTDGRTDQYALACTAFELLTGSPPFQRPEATAVMYAHLSAPPPPVTSLCPELPAAADQVLARALAKAPASRYGSCTEFAGALAAVLGTPPQRGRSRPRPPSDHPATQVDRHPPQGAAPPGPSAEDALGRTVTTAQALAESPADDAIAGAPADARTGTASPAPAKRRAWTRDWTAWTLIVFLPATIFGIVGLNRVMGAVGYGIGGTVLTLAWLAAIAAVIAKLVRMLRRWRQRRQRAGDRRPGLAGRRHGALGKATRWKASWAGPEQITIHPPVSSLIPSRHLTVGLNKSTSCGHSG